MAVETTVKERPILFSGPMVRAILGGRKTVTRRIMKHQPEMTESEDWFEAIPGTAKGWFGSTYPFEGSRKARWFTFSDPVVSGSVEHLRPGVDRKPTKKQALKSYNWHVGYKGEPQWSESEIVSLCPYGKPGDRLWVKETWGVAEVDDNPGVVYRATDPDWQTMTGWKWRPSIFMRRTASRITLEIESIRAERLHDVTEEDAVREGFRQRTYRDGRGVESARHGFKSLWGHLNGEESWDANPWVWVISFKRLTP